MTTLELTVFAKDGGPLTKSIRLDKSGHVISDGSACLMARGTARRMLFNGMTELANIIAGIRSNEAMASGCLRDDLPAAVRVTTKSARDKMNGSAPPDLIARTAEAITFIADQPSLVLFDFDQKGMPESVAARLAELGGFWPALTTIVPSLADASHLIRASTSAGLYRKDTGQQLGGSGGLHAYAAAMDGSDIERFLKVLHQRCWLAGLGWLMVGDAGQFLERSIIDRMVGAPERLIFEGPPILSSELGQDQASRTPQVYESELLDTRLCQDLTPAEAACFRDLIRAEEKRLAPERARKRQLFINDKSKELSQRTGLDPAAALQIIECQCKGILMPEIVLPFDNPVLGGVTVGQVLDCPENFVGKTLADPLEGIAYGAGKAKILRRPDGTPFIHSFAHGRTIYELRREPPSRIAPVILKTGREYEMQKIEWWWPGWLAAGKLHLLAGQKSTGKSTIAIDLMARVSAGMEWPDGTLSPLGDVMIWSGEDKIRYHPSPLLCCRRQPRPDLSDQGNPLRQWANQTIRPLDRYAGADRSRGFAARFEARRHRSNRARHTIWLG